MTYNVFGGTLNPAQSINYVFTAKSRCRLDMRRYFFSQRVIDRWNRLDQSVIDSTTINAFTTGLSRTRNASIGFFMDWQFAKPFGLICSGLRNQVWPHLVCTWYVQNRIGNRTHFIEWWHCRWLCLAPKAQSKPPQFLHFSLPFISSQWVGNITYSFIENCQNAIEQKSKDKELHTKPNIKTSSLVCWLIIASSTLWTTNCPWKGHVHIMWPILNF